MLCLFIIFLLQAVLLLYSLRIIKIRLVTVNCNWFQSLCLCLVLLNYLKFSQNENKYQNFAKYELFCEKTHKRMSAIFQQNITDRNLKKSDLHLLFVLALNSKYIKHREVGCNWMAVKIYSIENLQQTKSSSLVHYVF